MASNPPHGRPEDPADVGPRGPADSPAAGPDPFVEVKREGFADAPPAPPTENPRPPPGPPLDEPVGPAGDVGEVRPAGVEGTAGLAGDGFGLDLDLPPGAMPSDEELGKAYFGPPSIPTLVHCIHCHNEYESWQIEWRVETGRRGRPMGFWCCPVPGCDGKGFGFDIWPVDPDYVDEETGEKMCFFDDEDDEDEEGDEGDDFAGDDGFDPDTEAAAVDAFADLETWLPPEGEDREGGDDEDDDDDFREEDIPY